MPTALPPHELRAGQQLGSLRLSRPLGRGGFAPVWLADQIFHGRRLREVAAKLFFLPDGLLARSPEADRWAEDVLAEAEALCRLQHARVVRCWSVEHDPARGILGLAMEYVPGPSLEAAIAQEGPLDSAAVIDAGADIAWALAAVHDAGLVHRDVKPGNIIRGRDGCKLIDFGISVPIHQEENRTAGPRAGGVTESDTERDMESGAGPAGTPGYIAPECLRRGSRAAPASDLYALGATLLRLLTGRRPVDWGPAAVDAEVRAAGVAAPDRLLELMRWLLQLDPSARPSHADQVARRLERIPRRRVPAAPARSSPLAGREIALESGQPTEREPGAPWCEVPISQPALNIHPPLLGRAGVMTTIRGSLAEARAGRVQVALLTGPSGIGRTRLLEESVAAALAGGTRVLHARCDPEAREPLRPLAEALEALLEAGAGNLSRLVDAVEGAMAERGDAGASGDALGEIEAALLEASRAAPLLLAIDDLQWADASMLAIVRRLAARAGQRGGLMVLGAARDEPHASEALADVVNWVGASAQPALRRLRLRALSIQEARQVVQAMGPCTPELVEAAAHGAGGIPSLLVHAMVTWRETRSIAWQSGVWSAVDTRALWEEVPEFAKLLRARLAGWYGAGSGEAEAALRALACVALHGGWLQREVVLRVLAATGGAWMPRPGPGGDQAAESIVEALVEVGLLQVSRDGQGLSFAQEMMRQAALNLTRARRWFDEVLRALLDTLGSRGPAKADAAFLANGYERLGDAKEARRWLRHAMRKAAAVGLFEEALRCADRLAARARDEDQRIKAELSAVRVAIRGRAFQEARQRLEVSGQRMASGPETRAQRRRRRCNDVEQRILALEAARWLGGAEGGDAALIEDAEAVRDAALVCRALLALAGVAPAEEGLALAGRAVAQARLVGERLELTARVRRLEINREAARFDAELAEEDLRRALAIVEARGSAWDRIHLEADLAILESDRGRVEAAIERLRRLTGEAERQGMRGQLRLMLHNLSVLLLRTGRCAEAASASRQVAAMAEDAGDPLLGARALSVRADALLRLGDAASALAAADEAARLQDESNDRRLSLTLLRRAEIKQTLGRPEEALSDVHLAREVAEAHGEVDLGLSARLWEALGLARLGVAGPAVVARALNEATRARVSRQPLTLRLMAEATEFLAQAG